MYLFLLIKYGYIFTKLLIYIYCDILIYLLIIYYVICNKISIMYNDHNLLSICNMIRSIIKSSTNKIDTHYDSML
jgi:hypothetical protein